MHWLQLFCIAMGIADNTNNNNKRLKSNMFVKKKEGCFENKIRRWQALTIFAGEQLFLSYLMQSCFSECHLYMMLLLLLNIHDYLQKNSIKAD